MKLFGRKDQPATAPAPEPAASTDVQQHMAPPSGISLVKGNVSLTKGDGKVLMEKSPVVTFKCSWPPSKDYDAVAQAMVVEGGTPVQRDIATYGTMRGGPGKRMRYDAKDGGWIEHAGDIKTEGGTEIIRVRFSPMILGVSFFAYSAKKNGAGSFRQYGVSMEMDNGAGTKITISDKEASDDYSVYTCVPATVTNTPNGLVVDPTARYSAPGQENRPRVEWAGGQLKVLMDQGPENERK